MELTNMASHPLEATRLTALESYLTGIGLLAFSFFFQTSISSDQRLCPEVKTLLFYQRQVSSEYDGSHLHS